MKIISFFKNIKRLNKAGVIGTFGGTCFTLISFLMGIEQRGYHGITVWFQFPALIFCFCMFCLTLIYYIRND